MFLRDESLDRYVVKGSSFCAHQRGGREVQKYQETPITKCLFADVINCDLPGKQLQTTPLLTNDHSIPQKVVVG